jgi:hypothetical protein
MVTIPLWIAVFVLLVANLCLALKIRRIERKFTALNKDISAMDESASEDERLRFLEQFNKQIEAGGRLFAEETRLRQQQHEAQMALLRQRGFAS